MHKQFSKTKKAFQNVFLASYEKKVFVRNNLYDSEGNLILKKNREVSEKDRVLGNDGLVSISD